MKRAVLFMLPILAHDFSPTTGRQMLAANEVVIGALLQLSIIVVASVVFNVLIDRWRP